MELMWTIFAHNRFATSVIRVIGACFWQWAIAPVSVGAQANDVEVTMTSDHPDVVLNRMQLGQGSLSDGKSLTIANYHPLCRPPCALRLSTLDTYSVNGPGIAESRDFQLPRDREAVRIDVKAGRSSAFYGGTFLSIAGGGLFATGIVLTLINEGPGDEPEFADVHDRMRNLGVGLAVGGAVALVGGLVLYFVKGRTLVELYEPRRLTSR